MEIKEGLVFEKEFQTSEEHSAKHLGSGDVEVLSTPSVVLFIETTARENLDALLNNGKVTVGTSLNIKHFKASKIGEKVKVIVKLLSVDNGKFTFWAEVYSNNKKIASGLHERAEVSKKEFIEKLK